MDYLKSKISLIKAILLTGCFVTASVVINDIFTMISGAVLLIMLDALLGYILAVKSGTFDVKLVPKFLANNIFPYVGALILLAYVSLLNADFYAFFHIAIGLVGAKFTSEALIDKIKAIFS